jgi:hypothetical protein
MRQRASGRTLVSVRFSDIYIVLALALYAASLLLPDSTVPTDAITVKDGGKATLDYLLEMTKLAVALNSAMFSAAGALAVKGREWSRRWGTWESACVVIALLCGAASYYGVYKAYVSTLSMVYAGAISPFEQNLQVALSLQYYGILLGVFLIGFIFTRLLEKPAFATQGLPARGAVKSARPGAMARARRRRKRRKSSSQWTVRGRRE